MTPKQSDLARRRVQELADRFHSSIRLGHYGDRAAVADQDLLIADLEKALLLLKAYRASAAILDAVRSKHHRS